MDAGSITDGKSLLFAAKGKYLANYLVVINLFSDNRG